MIYILEKYQPSYSEIGRWYLYPDPHYIIPEMAYQPPISEAYSGPKVFSWGWSVQIDYSYKIMLLIWFRRYPPVVDPSFSLVFSFIGLWEGPGTLRGCSMILARYNDCPMTSDHRSSDHTPPGLFGKFRRSHKPSTPSTGLANHLRSSRRFDM